jgi:hypothetical protein
MVNESTKKPADQDTGPAGGGRQSKGGDTSGVGDNRGAGDVDGNQAGGNSKSRGATDSIDQPDRPPAKGA